jgi:hypothetical protein
MSIPNHLAFSGLACTSELWGSKRELQLRGHLWGNIISPFELFRTTIYKLCSNCKARFSSSASIPNLPKSFAPPKQSSCQAQLSTSLLFEQPVRPSELQLDEAPVSCHRGSSAPLELHRLSIRTEVSLDFDQVKSSPGPSQRPDQRTKVCPRCLRILLPRSPPRNPALNQPNIM